MKNQQVSIGLCNPKSATNVASILRAAGCFGVDRILYTGQRYAYAKNYNPDTRDFHKMIPTIGVTDLMELHPVDTSVVVIELVENAIPLPEFTHPEKAYYIFGPEDGSVPRDLVAQADSVVYIPTFHNMNLAATANVVLYDRLAKSQYVANNELIKQSRDNNNNMSR